MLKIAKWPAVPRRVFLVAVWPLVIILGALWNAWIEMLVTTIELSKEMVTYWKAP